MAGIDEVLERLVTDPGFRGHLQDDPRSALEGYVLYDDDLDVFEAILDEGEGVERGVEQRTSKSTLMGLVVGLSGAGVPAGAPSETGGDIAAHEAKDPLGVDMRAQSEAAGKGNVEYEWKVEEGTKAPPVHDEALADDPAGPRSRRRATSR